MKKYKIFSILIAFYSLFITNVQAQYPGCPNITIDQGDNITTSCTDPCVTLTATVLETGSTNQYTVSSIPYNPPFSYSGGTPVSVNTDDVWSSPISLPFNFCFFGNSYNTLWVGSNGVITFNDPSLNEDYNFQDPPYCPWSFSASVPSNSLITNGSVRQVIKQVV
jgi:hypothetical protein